MHLAISNSWMNHTQRAMASLGYRVAKNPDLLVRYITTRSGVYKRAMRMAHSSGLHPNLAIENKILSNITPHNSKGYRDFDLIVVDNLDVGDSLGELSEVVDQLEAIHQMLDTPIHACLTIEQPKRVMLDNFCKHYGSPLTYNFESYANHCVRQCRQMIG